MDGIPLLVPSAPYLCLHAGRLKLHRYGHGEDDATPYFPVPSKT